MDSEFEELLKKNQKQFNNIMNGKGTKKNNETTKLESIGFGINEIYTCFRQGHKGAEIFIPNVVFYRLPKSKRRIQLNNKSYYSHEQN